ncbi:MAG: hypothetical protein FIA89_00065 [Geobacter sp.]|nr:hypothetical protein [Geobacter sp.]
MKRICIDWYEIAYLMVQGFEPAFEPSATHPQNLDAVFDESDELDICLRDFRSNKGVAVLSLQAAMNHIARLNRKHREGRSHAR